MVRQHREVVVIAEQRQMRIMWSSAAPLLRSSTIKITKKISSESKSISPSPSSQDSATLLTQLNEYHATTHKSSSSSPPPSKAPPPSSLPTASPPPPPTATSNPPPKTSASPPPPSPESESPSPESSELPLATESSPESSPSDFEPPPPQSGSMQTLSTSGSYSPRTPSSSTSSLPLGNSPSSPPTFSNDSPPPPPIASTATLFSQSAADATPNTSKNPSMSPSPTSQSPTSLSNGTASSSNGTSNLTPTSSSPSGTSSSNETSNSTPTSSSHNGPASPSNETSNSTPTSSSSSPSSSSPINSHSGAVNGAVVGAVAGVIIILLLGILFLFIKGKRKRVDLYTNSYHPPPADQKNYYGQTTVLSGEHMHAPNSFGSQQGGNTCHGGGPEIGGSKSFFSYEELMEITSGFSHQNIIGEGGFGCVFRGQLPDGRAVAVKQLKADSGQGEREFRAEVDIISRVHHRHLVSLVGYCIAEHRRLLIYEFVPNKTLEHHLHGNEMPVLEWTKRLKIALGSAKGLAYLHEDCHPKIIHRDIKSANILLDDAFEAQVADFGLAKLTNDANTHVSTRVMGTFGYLAPEYASSGKLTDRSDVFSFGVVLLELLTGRKPVDSSQPLGDESLVEWARPRLAVALESGDFSELVDPRLGKSYGESELVRMMDAAAACIRHSAPKRPRMAQVVRALDCGEELSDLSNGVKYGQSTLYNSDQYSQDIIRFRRMETGDDDSSEYESTALKSPVNNNQTSWKSHESSTGLGNSYGHEIEP